jgi:hypothetical protein
MPKTQGALYFDSRRWPEARRTAGRKGPRKPVRSRRGLGSEDVFLGRDEYKAKGTTIRHEAHYHRGLRVFRSARVVKKARGKTRARRTPTLFRIPRRLALRADVGPLDATRAAIAFLQRRKRAPAFGLRVVRETCFRHLLDTPAVIELRSGLEAPARLHLEIFPEPGGRAQLAWVGDLPFRNGRRFHVAVSATGRRPKVLFAAQTNACAFGADWVPFPPTPEPGSFPQPPITTPSGAAGSPSQWQSGVLAEGPNVSCRFKNGSKAEALGILAVDNTFVWCNLLHDLFAEFGFDGDHHGFEGSDPLVVRRLPDKDSRAGFFDNQVDGWSPTLLLYSTPFGSSDHAGVDPSIVIHEYVHGVSHRLVGGDQCPYPFLDLEAMGFSEGTSDYFALTILGFLSRARNGAGASALTVFGGMFRPGGLRDYTRFAGNFSSALTDPYDIGMVWCSALLQARDQLAGTPRQPGKEDRVDRFLWQSSVNALKAMAPVCRQSLRLTLAHAKDALQTAASALEAQFGVAGAAGVIDAALTARSIG